jgi:pimeloyl-ACP methyl ester carboxylesterase
MSASVESGRPPAPVPPPVDQGFFADVRGARQWITLRGADAANPPLLMIFGPGAGFTRMAPFFAPWERDFTLVQWDQPGGGATYATNGDEPLSLDRLAADAAAVVEIALARLRAPKLVVLGVSGGSIVGLQLAEARPDLVAAYVGTGQIVHWARQAARGYRLALDAAKARGDAGAVSALEAAGPPPYADLATEMAASLHVNTQTAAERAAFETLDPATAARWRPRRPARSTSRPTCRCQNRGRAPWRRSSRCGTRSLGSTPGRRRGWGTTSRWSSCRATRTSTRRPPRWPTTRRRCGRRACGWS